MAYDASPGGPPDVSGGLSTDDAAELRQRLHDFNAEVTGYRDGMAIGCVVRDDAGRIVAGIDGFTWGGYARIEYLWVAVSLRRSGMGTALVTAVLAEAQSRGCTTVIVDTHTFQAPEFYARLGFVEVGRTTGTPAGHDQVLLQRPLP